MVPAPLSLKVAVAVAVQPVAPPVVPVEEPGLSLPVIPLVASPPAQLVVVVVVADRPAVHDLLSMAFLAYSRMSRALTTASLT